MGDNLDMPAWRDYQENVAAYYRGLGLTAQTDVRLDGARGRHDVDVVVHGHRAGVEFLWIIECKFWNRRVPKEAVATLSTIVHDVGADRGILLSRRGFQSGAPMLASKSNITLTSLDELLAATEDEHNECQCALLRKRCDAVIHTVRATRFHERIGLLTRFEPGGDSIAFDSRAGVLKTAIDSAMSGDWPVTVIRITSKGPSSAAPENIADLITLVDFTLSEIESELAVWLSELDC